MLIYEKIIHIIWFLFPTFFFLLALWSKLEQLSGSPSIQDTRILFKQGVFLLLCCLIAVGVDRYLFVPHLQKNLPEWLPLALLQILLFPTILLLAALCSGGSKDITLKVKKGDKKERSNLKKHRY